MGVLLSLLLGPIGWTIVFFGPDKRGRCARFKELTQTGARICAHCGKALFRTAAFYQHRENRAKAKDPIAAREAEENLAENMREPECEQPTGGDGIPRLRLGVRLNMNFARLATMVLPVLILTSCNAIWMLSVGVVALAQSGHRDVSGNRKYWHSIERNKKYILQRAVSFSQAGEGVPFDLILHPLSGAASGETISVYYRSDGLNYFWRDYIAIVESGRLHGKKVRLNNLLIDDRGQKTMSLDSRYLKENINAEQGAAPNSRTSPSRKFQMSLTSNTTSARPLRSGAGVPWRSLP